MHWVKYRITTLLLGWALATSVVHAKDLHQAAVWLAANNPAELTLASENSKFSVGPVNGAPGGSIPLKVRLPAGTENSAGSTGTYTFLMFKGLPDSFKLSAGFKTKNTWMVAIHDLSDLKVEIPSGYQGDLLVDAILYLGESVAPEKEVFSIRISPPTGISASETIVGVLPPTPAPSEKAPPIRDPSLTTEEEAAMLRQGETQTQSGNIVFARLLFEHLATRGSAPGTFQLARTYDPAVLRQLGTVGIQGDIEKAKRLYQRAADLGSTQASKALSALGH